MKSTARYNRENKSSSKARQAIYQFYLNKYFNLFMNAYEWDGLDEQQIDYIMRRFWSDGKVAAYRLPKTEDIVDKTDVIIFTPFAPSLFNIYDWPIKLQLINTRGVKFIPDETLDVNKDVVIGYAQRNKKSVFATIDNKINQIVDIEMTIRTNLIVHKMPWLVGVTPESRKKMEQLFNNIESDNPKLFVDLEDVDRAKALVSGAPYILDKLYNLLTARENEILTFLGIDNIGGIEKKEHLNADEVNSNNQVINNGSECFLYMLQNFCDDIKDVLGYDVNVRAKSAPVAAIADEGEDEDTEDEEK